jgi:hypothetical protein
VSEYCGDSRHCVNALSTHLTTSLSLYICIRTCSLLEKSLNPEKYPWHTLHKAVLLLHTITLYGSEVAIDGCIQLFRSIDKLQDYNSALVKQGGFFAVGGTDYGAPVRDAAKELCAILINDDNIRRVRQEAQGTGAESLVPMGEDFLATFTASQGKSNAENAGFGQGRESSSTSLGAGFDLSQVPGMYDNRPDRYFDDKNDVRAATTVGDHQFTREVGILLHMCIGVGVYVCMWVSRSAVLGCCIAPRLPHLEGSQLLSLLLSLLLLLTHSLRRLLFILCIGTEHGKSTGPRL